MLTAPFGVAYIETRFDALIGAYACAMLVAEHARRVVPGAGRAHGTDRAPGQHPLAR